MTDKSRDGPILVPLDFSSTSLAAFVYAARLAKCMRRPLLVLHVIHDPASMPGYYGRALKKKQLERIEDGAAVMLDDLIRSAIADHPEVRRLDKLEQLSSMLVTGLPSGRILEVAEKAKASLIVIGSKGLTGLKHLLMGSVAEQVVRLAPMPVTVVKSRDH